MMIDILICSLLLIGTFFTLVGSIGLLRMPDLYTRMHALTKGVTLGLLGLFLAAILVFQSWVITFKVILALGFIFLTNPVGAHMIARAAYHHLKVPFWTNTFAKEWQEPSDD